MATETISLLVARVEGELMPRKETKHRVREMTQVLNAAATTNDTSAALDWESVRIDIGIVMRDVVIRSTPFTAETYTPLIVPKKALPGGWEASLPNWAMTLQAVASQARSLKPEYATLYVTVADAEATLAKPLDVAADLLTERIIQQKRMMLSGRAGGDT